MRVSGGGCRLRVTQEAPDHRQGPSDPGTVARECVPQIVQADTTKSRNFAHSLPRLANVVHRLICFEARKNVRRGGARQLSQDLLGKGTREARMHAFVGVAKGHRPERVAVIALTEVEAASPLGATAT